MKENKYKCDYNECQKRFYLKIRFNSFIHTFIREKNHLFVIIKKVKKKSLTKSYLCEHMRRHLGIKRHKCYYNECDMSFVTLTELKSHISKIDLKIKLLKCKVKNIW